MCEQGPVERGTAHPARALRVEWEGPRGAAGGSGVAYDESVAQRVRETIGPRPDVVEIRMFGGLAFVLNGNMSVGVIGSELMVRVGPDAYEDALALPHARLMDFTGKPLRGFVYVAAEGFRKRGDMQRWVERGLRFAASLPPKAGRTAPGRARRVRAGAGPAARKPRRRR